jgi:hypothetical protein
VAKRRARSAKKTTATGERWVAKVMARSNALDIPLGTFRLDSPRAIAQALKKSALRSRRRKSAPFRSALSMLTFYLNRAGSNLSARRRGMLEAAKDELRKLFAKEPRRRAS